MGLTIEFIDAHIAGWQQRLTSPFYPHRKHWPANLFHHAPLENAVAILNDGHLRSRNDSQNLRPRDIAAPGVIDTRRHAHDRVRLYFRPKTPTQWHVEGIRKTGECQYGDETHSGVLVMFALDARLVLSMPDIMFSNQNMQLSNTTPGSDEAYFSQIPFDKVYSEGGTGGDKSFTYARCAEVLPSSPLPLSQCLRAIYFRSEAERDTLFHLLGAGGERWQKYVHVSDALKVFQKEYTFFQELRLTKDGVVFKFNHRKDRRPLKVSIKIDDILGNRIADFFNLSHAAAPEPPYGNWIWRTPLADGAYIVEVRLEDTLAYRGRLQVGDSLF